MIACILYLSFGAARADVLHDRDNGPLTGYFGLPDSTEGSVLTAQGHHRWDLSYVLSSHDLDDKSGDEILRLDGETTRLGFNYRQGLGSRMEVGFELPWLWHASGSFDKLIEQWHDFFGLPNGLRSQRPRDQIEFFYADGLMTPINVRSSSSGFSDMRLFAAWQLASDANYSTALRFAIKLPTGDSGDLLGSGGSDISLGIAGDHNSLWGSPKLSGFYRLNLTYLGEPDRLADRYNSMVGQLSSGLGYLLTPNIDLRVQTRLRSALYDSAIDNLGKSSISVTFGASFKLSNAYRLGLSVGEDIKVGTAPDVSFQITLVHVGG